MPGIMDCPDFCRFFCLSGRSGAGANAVTREATTVATVDRIDRSSRVLTAHSDGNVGHTLYVDPSVKTFDDLEVGDVVTVRYIESVVVQVRPNAKLTEVQDTTAVGAQGR